MSGTNLKKVDGLGRREARALQEMKEKRKTRTIAIIIVGVLVLLFIVSAYINSKMARRNITAITIGDFGFTATEYDFFYQSIYADYSNTVYQDYGESAAESMLPKRETPLSSQIHDYETGETWADFFHNRVLQQMTELVLFYNDAKSKGWAISGDDRAAMDEEFENLKLSMTFCRLSCLVWF